MLRIHEIKLGLKEKIDVIPDKLQKKLHIKDGELLSWRIVRESIDARNKSDIKRIYTVDFEVKKEAAVLKRNKGVVVVGLPRTNALAMTEGKIPSGNAGINPSGGCADQTPQTAAPSSPIFRATEGGQTPSGGEFERPVVVGFGPCGMFAALMLAENGYKPLIVERGRRLEERVRDVELFWKEGRLSPVSNVQFGEGGAGAFSDGKLNSGIKNTYRTQMVLEALVAHGAPPEILYKQNPHVGTDILREVVTSIRKRIEILGGSFMFESCFTGIIEEDGKLKAIELNEGELIDAEVLVIAPGHSARDTFKMLYDKGFEIEQKSFSIGVRIEHPQEMINISQYGSQEAADILGAADYKLSYRCADGRGVYTFCMCPGGYVVASASEEGGVVTNGMSYHKRDGKNANSALLVGVGPEDFGSDYPLAGVEFQRKWEQAAYEAGGRNYFAPAQLVGDFMSGIPSSGEGEVKPEYMPGVTWTNLETCLPEFAVKAMREALPQLGKKLKGFDRNDGVMTGVETRSSSPVRIKRGENLQCHIEGIFPAGEGAGYAGGIMSAAVDGIRTAEKIMELYGNRYNERTDEK